jgi:hypothetical protein
MISDERKAQDQALRNWSAQAHHLIRVRLSDAASHAEGNRGSEAMARMDELAAVLRAHLSDARGAFYRSSWEHHQPGAAVHPAELKVARTAAILNRDQHADLDGLVKQAKAGLRSIIVMGGGSDLERLNHWQGSHAGKLGSHMASSLSNAQIALHNAALVLSVPPELR